MKRLRKCTNQDESAEAAAAAVRDLAARHGQVLQIQRVHRRQDLCTGHSLRISQAVKSKN